MTKKNKFPLMGSDKESYDSLKDIFTKDENPDGHEIDQAMGLGMGTWGDDDGESPDLMDDWLDSFGDEVL